MIYQLYPPLNWSILKNIFSYPLCTVSCANCFGTGEYVISSGVYICKYNKYFCFKMVFLCNVMSVYGVCITRGWWVVWFYIW